MNNKVRNLHLVSADAYQVILQWDAPYNSYGGEELYKVKYYMKGYKVNTTRTNLSRETRITIVGLQYSTEYYFMVSESFYILSRNTHVLRT